MQSPSFTAVEKQMPVIAICEKFFRSQIWVTVTDITKEITVARRQNTITCAVLFLSMSPRRRLCQLYYVAQERQFAKVDRCQPWEGYTFCPVGEVTLTSTFAVLR